MSVQINQYLMYGIKLSGDFYKQWEAKNEGQEFHEVFEAYTDDNPYEVKESYKDGLFCLMHRNSQYIIIGRILERSLDGELIADNTAVHINKLSEKQKNKTKEAVLRVFGVTGSFGYYFATLYR